MEIIEPTTDRVAELETLRDELTDARKRLNHTSAEGKRIIMHQIRQIERDIRRNSMKGGTPNDTQTLFNAPL